MALRWGDLKKMDLPDDEPVVLPKRDAKRRREENSEKYRFIRIQAAVSQHEAFMELFNAWKELHGHEGAVDSLIAAMIEHDKSEDGDAERI
jgi:hypothetical protein